MYVYIYIGLFNAIIKYLMELTYYTIQHYTPCNRHLKGTYLYQLGPIIIGHCGTNNEFQFFLYGMKYNLI